MGQGGQKSIEAKQFSECEPAVTLASQASQGPLDRSEDKETEPNNTASVIQPERLAESRYSDNTAHQGSYQNY